MPVSAMGCTLGFLLLSCGLAGVPSEIASYLEIQQHKEAAEKLDFEDKAILEGLVAVEKAHQEDVVLYHAVPFSIYMLSWIWNGVSRDHALKWEVLDVNAPYPIGKMPLSIRVFDGSKQFPSFSAPDPAVCPPPTGFAEVAEVDHPEVFVGRIVGSSSRKVQVKNGHEQKEYSLNSSSGCFPLVYLGKVKQAKYVDSLMEEQLVEHGVINASDFQQYCEKLGVWKDEHNTPDHIAGVRERLLSVNLNIFGSESWAESSWEIFRKGVSLHHSGLGGAVPFMDDILSALQVDEEVTSLVGQQMELINCITGNRTSNDFNGKCEALWKERWSLASCSSQEHPNELEVNDPWMPAEKCHKTIVGTSDNKKCGTDIMMQLIFPRDLAEQLVYISGAGGIPRDEFSKFLPAYDELKNTAAGDGHQGRILLKGDVFCRGLRSTFASHSGLFRDELLMTSLTALAEDVRGALLGRFEPCPKPALSDDPTTVSPSTSSSANEKTPVVFNEFPTKTCLDKYCSSH
ncbi:unnamed protein product [Durusdinium trenchii]|uniref:Uncharacterized protein n=1 Tax=Durusdinium trenchii TaxID=1381693 RepID=A0ABP0H6X7_9DINO